MHSCFLSARAEAVSTCLLLGWLTGHTRKIWRGKAPGITNLVRPNQLRWSLDSHRGTSLIRYCAPLGPYSKNMRRDPWRPYVGGGSFL
jgi:hypothetical protein